jgi:hypothetical protein
MRKWSSLLVRTAPVSDKPAQSTRTRPALAVALAAFPMIGISAVSAISFLTVLMTVDLPGREISS